MMRIKTNQVAAIDPRWGVGPSGPEANRHGPAAAGAKQPPPYEYSRLGGVIDLGMFNRK